MKETGNDILRRYNHNEDTQTNFVNMIGRRELSERKRWFMHFVSMVIKNRTTVPKTFWEKNDVQVENVLQTSKFLITECGGRP